LVGAVAAILALSVLGFFLFFPPRAPSEPAAKETLQGFSVGDNRDDLVARFGKPQRSYPGDPWREESKALGLVLRPGDLRPDGTWDGYETLIWSKNRIGAVFRSNLVQALIVRLDQRAENGRGLRLGDNESKLEHLYAEKPDIDTANVSAPPGHSLR